MALAQVASSTSRSNVLRPISAFISPNLRHQLSTDDTRTLTIETSIPFTSHKCESLLRSVETMPSELLSFFRDTMTMHGDRHSLALQGQADLPVLPPRQRRRGRRHHRRRGGRNHDER
ncbi:hypothetical protein SO802_025610 [Lithocarpus litseifolius]|uniref:Uncharacterized protein n=1 Tax=Lithocarpus litseifolius TaxID=425828 RepID=A0AAW2C0M9_9ROSI